MSKRRIRCAVSMLVLSLAASCGGGGREATQPAEDAPAFVSRDGDEIPVHPLAEPLGPATYRDNVTARSFAVRNVDPDGLFDWYTDALDGWRLVEPPASTGRSPHASVRAIWARDDLRLVVTASPASALADEGDEPRLQYSVSLEHT